MEKKKIKAEEVEAWLLKEYPHITGVKILNFPRRIRIYVVKKIPEKPLPTTIMGLPVEVIETGRIVALALMKPLEVETSRTERVRPLIGGISCGSPRITAGTLGGAAIDQATGKTVILSNAHVLTYYGFDALTDEPTIQPAPYDGGTLADKVGELARWIPIDFTGKANLVDAAVSRPTIEIKREILDLGEPTGVMLNPRKGLTLTKSGRTTGTTKGKIIDTGVTVRVIYPEGKVAIFRNQILTQPMLRGGDSGSLGLTEDGRIVGLAFAGSLKVSVFNPIRHVMEALNIGFGEAQPTPPSTTALTLGVATAPLAVLALAPKKHFKP